MAKISDDDCFAPVKDSPDLEESSAKTFAFSRKVRTALFQGLAVVTNLSTTTNVPDPRGSLSAPRWCLWAYPVAPKAPGISNSY